MDYQGKVAVITGAASGLGLGITKACADRGMKLALADINESKLGAVRQEMSERGLEVLAERIDVSEVDDVERFAHHTFKRFGQVNLLFNNAGVLGNSSTLDAMLKDWEWIVGVNMWGVINGVRAFIPRMMDSGKIGHVVNIAGGAGFISGPGVGIYRMTKAAVVSISETLYHELSIIKSKIGVSVVSPAFIKTSIMDADQIRPKAFQHMNQSNTNNPVEESVLGFFRQQVETAPRPQAVAEAIFSGIDQRKLYIFTPSLGEDIMTRQAISDRMEAILTEKNQVNPFSGTQYD